MATSTDFCIYSNTGVTGVSLVMPMNEDAFSYLTEEEELRVLNDGSAPLATDKIGDFISDAGQAHMCCDLI
tara:strand:+ start:566 stop:778 length:213 start_codon:yes stop_codon:yes gene_type:complete